MSQLRALASEFVPGAEPVAGSAEAKEYCSQEQKQKLGKTARVNHQQQKTPLSSPTTGWINGRRHSRSQEHRQSTRTQRKDSSHGSDIKSKAVNHLTNERELEHWEGLEQHSKRTVELWEVRTARNNGPVIERTEHHSVNEQNSQSRNLHSEKKPGSSSRNSGNTRLTNNVRSDRKPNTHSDSRFDERRGPIESNENSKRAEPRRPFPDRHREHNIDNWRTGRVSESSSKPAANELVEPPHKTSKQDLEVEKENPDRLRRLAKYGTERKRSQSEPEKTEVSEHFLSGKTANKHQISSRGAPKPDQTIRAQQSVERNIQPLDHTELKSIERKPRIVRNSLSAESQALIAEIKRSKLDAFKLSRQFLQNPTQSLAAIPVDSEDSSLIFDRGEGFEVLRPIKEVREEQLRKMEEQAKQFTREHLDTIELDTGSKEISDAELFPLTTISQAHPQSPWLNLVASTPELAIKILQAHLQTMKSDPFKKLDHDIFARDENGNSALHICASLGHSRLLQILLDFPALPSSKQQAHSIKQQKAATSTTALTASATSVLAEETPFGASLWSSVEPEPALVVEEQDETRAFNISDFNHQRATPLHCAAEANQLECIRILTGFSCLGSSLVTSKDDRGNRPLHLAVQQGHFDVVRELVSLRASPQLLNKEGNNCLHLAIRKQHTGLVDFFLRHHRSMGAVANARGRTGVHLAAMVGSSATLNELLKAGLEVNPLDKDDKSALHYAVDSGSAECVSMLLERKANVHGSPHSELFGFSSVTATFVLQPVLKQLTPLHLAVIASDLAMCKLLCSYGASAAFRAGTVRETPLHIAMRVGDVNVVKYLLAISQESFSFTSTVMTTHARDNFGTWINMNNANAYTALKIGVSCGHFYCVQELLSLPAGWGPSVSDVQKALVVAIQLHYTSISAFLLCRNVPLPDTIKQQLVWPTSYHRRLCAYAMPRFLNLQPRLAREKNEEKLSLAGVAHRVCMRSLINSPLFSDVSFMIEGKQFYAHRCILSAQSDYFRALLCGPLAEAQGSDPLSLHDMRWPLFEVICEYLYIGVISAKLPPELLFELVIAANEFLLTDLVSLCAALAMSQGLVPSSRGIGELFHFGTVEGATKLQQTMAEHCSNPRPPGEDVEPDLVSFIEPGREKYDKVVVALIPSMASSCSFSFLSLLEPKTLLPDVFLLLSTSSPSLYPTPMSSIAAHLSILSAFTTLSLSSSSSSSASLKSQSSEDVLGSLDDSLDDLPLSHITVTLISPLSLQLIVSFMYGGVEALPKQGDALEEKSSSTSLMDDTDVISLVTLATLSASTLLDLIEDSAHILKEPLTFQLWCCDVLRAKLSLKLAPTLFRRVLAFEDSGQVYAVFHLLCLIFASFLVLNSSQLDPTESVLVERALVLLKM